MTRLQEYEQKLEHFPFGWDATMACGCDDPEHHEEMWMRERQLLIEAEHLGVDAVKLFRQYQLGVL